MGRNWEHWADIWDIGQILRTLGRHWAEIEDIGQKLGTLGRQWADIGEILGRNWADIRQMLGRHWADIGQTLESSIFLIKLSVLLMQDKTFQFSYPR